MAIGYHSDMSMVAPDAQIVAVQHLWGDYSPQRARAVLDGSWKSGNVWGGVKEGMIRVGNFGPTVPKAVQAEVLARQKDIADGKLQPFRAASADVRDNEGKVRIPAGKALGHIRLPERCANLCFGGAKRNRLFMAASHSLYALYVNVQGAT